MQGVNRGDLMEKEIVEFARNLASNNPLYAYIFFFINAALQILFPPYPGDTILVFEGYLSSQRVLNTFLMLFISLSATYLSSIFLYSISYKFGHSLVANKFVQKNFDIKRIEKLEEWFKKYGSLAIIINKFLPGVGSLTLIAAGLFNLPPIPAFVSIGVATIIHNTALFMAGRLTGDNIILIKTLFKEYNRIIVLAILIIAALYLYVKMTYNKKKDL
jgi:membrane protein DedA with SNARE-associated domain